MLTTLPKTVCPVDADPGFCPSELSAPPHKHSRVGDDDGARQVPERGGARAGDRAGARDTRGRLRRGPRRAPRSRQAARCEGSVRRVRAVARGSQDGAPDGPRG